MTDSLRIDLAGLSRRKSIAAIFLLPACDMSCCFCASDEDFSVISFEQAEGLLEALRSRGITNVVFGGGEPLLWPHDLQELCRRAHEMGFLVQLCTNGLSLTSGFARTWKIDRYILPLESMDQSVHDQLRGHLQSHHEQVLQRIDCLSGTGRELTISTVVTSQNLNGLPSIAAYLEEQRRAGVEMHAWHLYRFLPIGRGGLPNGAEMAVTTEQYRKACSEAKACRPGFPVYRRDNMLHSSSVEYFWSVDGRVEFGDWTAPTPATHP